jgi:excisionase family DNA binding protein
MGDVLTPSQVAAYLQVSTETVYRLIRRRQLAASRVGRRYRIPRRDLEAFIAATGGRAAIRERQFQRVLEIAQRNADVDGDALLEELERQDAAERAPTRVR